jgi:hypothetical protein
MRRNLLSIILPGAMLAAGTLCAAPNQSGSSAQYLSQITEQTNEIQAQADGLEGYVRAGGNDWANSTAYIFDLAQSEQKLLAVLDQIAAKPGATNETRIQVDKMKTIANELMVFTGTAQHDLDMRTLPLHQRDVFANMTNIENRCDSLRSSAEALLAAR